jgi:hypothetical protein
MATRMVEYDLGDIAVGAFKTPATSGIVAGYVDAVIGSDWTIRNSSTSATVAPIGVVTQSVASNTSTGIEVRTTGYVWMNCHATQQVSAGQPAFPCTGARVMTTGKSDASGNLIFAGGFGTVVIGGSSNSTALIKLARL